MSTCFYCHKIRETRPYGPGGVDICFPCMKEDSERERRAGEIFAQKINVYLFTLLHPAGQITYIGEIPEGEDEK